MKNNIIEMGNRGPNLLRKLESEKKRMMAFSSLASILIAVTLANNSLFSTQKQHLRDEITAQAQINANRSSERSIASISPDAVKTENLISTESLLKRYESNPTMQAMGAKPNSIEKLAYGLLEGKYAVRVAEGKLREIEFIESASQVETPKYIENRMAFIRDLSPYLPDGFSEVTQVQKESRREVYSLRDSSHREVAKVIFVNDDPGRVLSVSVEAQ